MLPRYVVDQCCSSSKTIITEMRSRDEYYEHSIRYNKFDIKALFGLKN